MSAGRSLALAALTLAASAAPVAPSGAQATPLAAEPASRASAIRDAVRDTMARLGIPGLSLAVVEGGVLRFEEAHGHADVENGVPARPESVYRLASVSKPMTAVAVLHLYERGQIDLDAPVWRYCPEFPEKPWPVTARQLLCHQGGIPGADARRTGRPEGGLAHRRSGASQRGPVPRPGQERPSRRTGGRDPREPRGGPASDPGARAARGRRAQRVITLSIAERRHF